MHTLHNQAFRCKLPIYHYSFQEKIWADTRAKHAKLEKEREEARRKLGPQPSESHQQRLLKERHGKDPMIQAWVDGYKRTAKNTTYFTMDKKASFKKVGRKWCYIPGEDEEASTGEASSTEETQGAENTMKALMPQSIGPLKMGIIQAMHDVS